MINKDLHNNIENRSALNNSNITSNTTTVGNTIDTLGYEAIEFLIQSGVITDGSYAFQVFEGDASNMSDEVQVAAGNILGTIPTLGASDDNVVKRFGIKMGSKRYMRLKVVSTGVTTGGNMEAQALLGNPLQAPTP